MILVVGCGAAASGQTSSATPRTPWGHPDLQGRWTNATVTLLERPVEFGAKEFFTVAGSRRVFQDGARAVPGREQLHGGSGDQRRVRARRVGRGAKHRPHAPYLAHRRPNGSHPRADALPPGRGSDARNAQRKQNPDDGPEARALNERCLWFPIGGPPLLPGIGYNSNHQIVQTPTHVVIYTGDGRRGARDSARRPSAST